MPSQTLSPWAQMRLGIFFFFGLTILVAGVFVVGTNKQIFKRHYTLKLYMDNAQGLSRGAVVSLSGLQVGSVKDMDFTQHEGRHVIEFSLSVETGYRSQITESSTATIRTIGVLGDKFIDISLGDLEENPIPEGGDLRIAAGTTDWTQTLERSANALDDVIELIQETQTLLSNINQGKGALGVLASDEQAGRNLRTLIENLSQASDAIQAGQGTMGRLLTNADLFDKTVLVLDRIDHLALAATEGDGALAKLFFDEQMASRLEHVVQVSDSLLTAAPSSGTLGKLMTDDQVYLELLKSLSELKTLVQDIRENPEKYVRVSVF